MDVPPYLGTAFTLTLLTLHDRTRVHPLISHVRTCARPLPIRNSIRHRPSIPRKREELALALTIVSPVALAITPLRTALVTL